MSIREWKRVSLGELESRGLTLRSGFPQGGFNETGEGVPHLRPFNVTIGGLIDLSQIKSVPAPAEDSPFWIREGDVIFNNTNSEDLVGKTAYFESAERCVFSNHMTVIRINDPADLDARWLSYYFLFRWRRGDFKAVCRRYVGQASVSLSKLREVIVHLPPLREQKAIAAALHAVHGAILARQQELELERERKWVLLDDLISHGAHRNGSADWPILLLGEIAAVAYGLTVNKSRRESERRVPYLCVANVSREGLHLADVKEIGVLDSDDERYALQNGDVLLIEGNGNPRLLGSAAIWNKQLPLALHQNHLIRVRSDRSLVYPEWVMMYVNSSAGRTQILSRAKTSSGLHTINSRIVKSLRIPVPPIEEQAEIIQVVTACDSKIAALEREIALHEELFQVLLEEMMTGQRSALPLVEDSPEEVMA